MGIIFGERLAVLPGVLSQSKRLVVDPSAQVQRLLHLGFLGFSGVDPELVSLTHIYWLC